MNRTARIEGYDLARAFAIFGMVLVNFRVVMTLGNRGTVSPSDSDWLLFLASRFDGRAAALFVILAGIGMTLGARRAVASGDASLLAAHRRKLWKRAGLLFAGGLVFSLVWPADILHFYGWYIGIGALFLAASNRTLLGGAGLLAVGFVVLLATLDYEAGWDFETFTYFGFWTAAGQVRHLFFNGFHPVVPWLAFLLVGMWLGRQDLRDPEVRSRFLYGGATVAMSAEALSAAFVSFFSDGASGEEAELVAALLGTEAMPPMPFYLAAAGGTAVAVIALAVALAERFPRFPGRRALVATGQLALTIYVAHVLLGMGALEAVGRLENQTLPFALASAVGFYAAAIIFSTLWTRHFGRGPLEVALRKCAGQ